MPNGCSSSTSRMHISAEAWPAGLQALAREYGVQRSFYGLEGQRFTAQPEVVLAVLDELGASVSRFSDIPAALKARQAAHWSQVAEPVAVVWNGQPASL